MPCPFPVILVICFLASFAVETGIARDTLDLYPSKPGALVCWSESRTEPRPLKIHYLRVDLTCTDLEIFTLAGQDPDGGGPAESSLTLPEDLFSACHALAAINANAFAGLPGTEKDVRGWYKGRPVDIQGMAVCDGKVISPGQEGRTSFWTDADNMPNIGNPKTGETVWQSVSDWSGPLQRNNLILADSAVTILHPRSAVGFPDSGRWILLVVVDGRQPGISEGMSLFELASLFRSKNCAQSVNLDGGGSSIMLVRQPDSSVQTVNSPSGHVHRPVPVMLGIRKKSN